MKSILAALVSVSVSMPAVADTLHSQNRTSTVNLPSAVLQEEREIVVRTPPDYSPDKTYPVVYVLDGEWNFELVASYLDYMADNHVFPQLIVTGVTNVNRNRDYVPRVDRYFDDTGGADKFLGFVKDEWVPYINENYPASENRILVGHSFGGVFTLHTFFTEPESFDAYIALGSSAWIADRVLFEEAEAWFAAPKNEGAYVYMAVGEGDGGPTVPSSRDLAALFELKAPASLEWRYAETPRTDHFKNMVSGMNEGFMDLFPAWEFEEELKAAVNRGGVGVVDQWFNEKEAALGWRFVPSWFDLGVAALQMVREGHADAARATVNRLVRYYPDNAHVAAFSANVLEQSGQLAASQAEYHRAIEITNHRMLHPNEMHLARLQRGLERTQAQLQEENDNR